MISLLLLFLPFAGSLIALSLKNGSSRYIALGTSLLSLSLAIYSWSIFPGGAGRVYELNIPWVASLGIQFHLGIDGISLLLVLLTNLLIPVIILTTFNHRYTRENIFYFLVLFMQTGLIGVFISMDAFLFYIFWEIALVPIYFICALWGGQNRIKVTIKFFVYTILGSLFMLAGIIYLYFLTPNRSFDIAAFYSLALDASTQRYVFLAFFMAFAIKMPVFPFHTWQPDTYTEAPAQGTMLLAGIMLKMGIYGVIRWILPIMPMAVAFYSPYLIALAVIGIIYASVIAFTQTDLKRLVAYSSIAHVGLIAAALFAANIFSLQGSMIQMLSHGINVVGLFFVISIIQQQTGTRETLSLGGIATKAPVLAVCFGLIMLGTIALPLTNGFVGEFLMLNGLFWFNPVVAAIAGLTIILGAVYMFRMYQKVMLGPASSATENFTDVQGIDRFILITLTVLIIITGVYPQPLLSLTEPAIQNIILQMGHVSAGNF